jgi:alpha-glucuronidase
MRLSLLLLPFIAHAETGYDAWLRYTPLASPPELPAVVVTVSDSPLVGSARDELISGVRGMTGRVLREQSQIPTEPAFVLGSREDLRRAGIQIIPDVPLAPDTWWITKIGQHTIITGGDDRGVLYGSFAFLRKLALGEPLQGRESPYAPARWVNHWDRLDGSIERGYGGNSIFWNKGKVRDDLSRVNDYGRMLASLGINACSINNVNADPRVITAEYLPQVARIAEAFRPWGVRIAISLDFGSPKTLGKLESFDPLDPQVAKWWRDKVDEIYRAIPDLAGFVLKADSEGRVGPSAYGRTHADAANVVAMPTKTHGGLVFYRGFVYDHHMDWQNLKNDRARAAWDNFHDLDGKFEDNVVIQIKHGPIDFQVREPASPLFGALEKTNQAVELQITQEYFGQGRQTVFLIPMWKEALDFDMHTSDGPTPVKALVAGKVFHQRTGGFVGVSNIGLDENWFGNHMSQANLYGFGRLAWNPDLTAQQISNEWTRLTFGNDERVQETVNRIQLTSWRTFENYTGPLGLQTLTDITGNHFGVNVEASERNGWGQWHRADDKGVGMDRTSAGTGYIQQYRPAVARVFESLETCPDDLVTFLHHVPYTYKLHNGKTVIQYLYDSHYEGADGVEQWVRDWKALAGRVDERRYHEVLAQLEYQTGQAEEWRDAVNTWFAKASGIPDEKGRVGKYPGRYEAEAMHLVGYKPVDVTPSEDASGGKAVSCAEATCNATHRFDGAAGWYTIRVRYFDQMNGVSHFRVRLGVQLIDEWAADDHVPTRRIDSTSSSRHTIRGVPLRPGDEIRIEGTPDGGETAAFDYVEILREK